MNKLIRELRRLYFHQELQFCSQTDQLIAASQAGDSHAALDLAGPGGTVRAMVVAVERASDWASVGALYRGLQDDLELPAPAIAVSGRGGYRVWLSLAGSVPIADAVLFLDALRRRYLADISAARLGFAPSAGQCLVDPVPALDTASGKWSAFIDPGMGAMFVDEPGLEMAPNMDRQADLLAGMESIAAAGFRRALASLQGGAEADAGLSEGVALRSVPEPGRTPSTLNVGNDFTDPQAFLLAVMNDPSATAGQRIKAAKALLPYFNAAGR